MSVIRRLNDSAQDDFEETMALLCTMAIFWCMRSCEFLSVPDQYHRKTKLLCIRNFRFFMNSKQIPTDSPLKYNATSVNITFEDQKNSEKFESVTCRRTGDPTLCPVIASAKLIDKIARSCKSASRDTTINSMSCNGKVLKITSSAVIKFLRRTVTNMGESLLGFTAKEIGVHSIRSGGAMALCLGGADQFKIQILGRWKSDSFMRYIRKQVEQFSAGLSNLMLQNEDFFHIKCINPSSDDSTF